jgi:hypothetical protein
MVAKVKKGRIMEGVPEDYYIIKGEAHRIFVVQHVEYVDYDSEDGKPILNVRLKLVE